MGHSVPNETGEAGVLRHEMNVEIISRALLN
jgi:hypothetical protein